MIEIFGTLKKAYKNPRPLGVVLPVLPFAVALLLTVKNQVIHICHELVHRHCTSLLFSIFILIIRLHLKVCKAVIVIFL